MQEIDEVCDKYPVNFNNICLFCYNKDSTYELKIKINTNNNNI